MLATCIRYTLQRHDSDRGEESRLYGRVSNEEKSNIKACNIELLLLKYYSIATRTTKNRKPEYQANIHQIIYKRIDSVEERYSLNHTSKTPDAENLFLR